MKIVNVEDLHCDVERRAKRCFRFPHQPCSRGQRALSLSLGALAFFAIGLATDQASSYSIQANSFTQGIAAPQQAVKGTMVQVSPGGGGGAMRQVRLSEIQKEATFPVNQGVTLDFTDGGVNKVTVQKSDDSSVVQVISKTNAVTLAPGIAHVSVAVFGECPKPTGMQVVSCDPIPVFSVTIKVQQP